MSTQAWRTKLSWNGSLLRAALLGASMVTLDAVYAAESVPATPDSAELQEVVVTAEHRAVDTQKLSLKVETITAQQLSENSVTAARDLTNLVPELHVSEVTPSGAGIAIRGVGAAPSIPLQSVNIGFNVDELSYSRPIGLNVQYFDLERVEVLLGPQGTLYGRNAVGGAINVISAKPTQTFGGNEEVEYGSYDEIRTTGAINLPFSPTLAMRVSYQTDHRNGYSQGGTNDADSKAVRDNLLWTPTDDFSLFVSAFYGQERGAGPAMVLRTGGAGAGYANPGNPWAYATSSPNINSFLQNVSPGYAYQFGVPRADGEPSQPYSLNTSARSVLTKATWDFGFASLTLIPTYLDIHSAQSTYNPTNPQIFTSDSRQVTGEARLAGQLGPVGGAGHLDWIVGGFYLHETAPYFAEIGVINPPLLTGGNGYFVQNWPDVANLSRAGFAQAAYSVLDGLRFIGGMRYTDESQDVNGISGILSAQQLKAGKPVNSTYVVPTVGSTGFNKVTYKVGVERDIGEHSMLYANVSTGVHAGGLNPGAPAVTATDQPNFYVPETLTAYSIGSKNQFWDNKIRLNLEVYDWEYHDLQITHSSSLNPEVPNPVPPPAGLVYPVSTRIDNAGAARVYGFDTDFQIRPTPEDKISLNLSYTQAVYLQYLSKNCISNSGYCTGTQFQTYNFSGQRIPATPPWKALFDYRHTFSLPGGATITPSATTTFSSGYNTVITSNRTTFGPLYDPGEYQGQYAKLDLMLAFVPESARWTLSAYARNVTNRAVMTRGTQDTVSKTANLWWVTLEPPRTFGVIASVHF